MIDLYIKPFALALAGLLGTGASATLTADEATLEAVTAHVAPSPAVQAPSTSPESRFARLTERLDLSPAQVEAIRDIFAERARAAPRARPEAASEPRKRGPARRRARNGVRGRVMSVLTPAQRRSLRNMRRERRARPSATGSRSGVQAPTGERSGAVHQRNAARQAEHRADVRAHVATVHEGNAARREASRARAAQRRSANRPSATAMSRGHGTPAEGRTRGRSNR